MEERTGCQERRGLKERAWARFTEFILALVAFFALSLLSLSSHFEPEFQLNSDGELGC